MNITVTIQAPELAKAIELLANAISNSTNGKNVTQTIQAEIVPFQQQVAPAAPVQVLPETPAAVPTAPIQPVQQQVQAPVVPEQPQVVPTSAPTYTMEQLAVAATQIMDAGRRNELVQLLASFGIQALTALPKEQYGVFATKLREMGARI